MKKNDLIGYKALKNELEELCNECITQDLIDLRYDYDVACCSGQMFEQQVANIYSWYVKRGLSEKIISFVFDSLSKQRYFDDALYKGKFQGYLSISQELEYYI